MVRGYIKSLLAERRLYYGEIRKILKADVIENHNKFRSADCSSMLNKRQSILPESGNANDRPQGG
jgi:hypothetical protein